MDHVKSIGIWCLITVTSILYACTDTSSLGPASNGEVVVRTITTDVSIGGTFRMQGDNLAALTTGGELVCYDGQDIRVPIRSILKDGDIVWQVPDSLRSGRMKIVDGSGAIVIDTVLHIYGEDMMLPSLPTWAKWNQRLDGDLARCRFQDRNGRTYDAIPVPAMPSTYVVPPISGAFTWVVYDATSGRYHRTTTSVIIKQPEVRPASRGLRPTAYVDHVAVPVEKCSLRLRGRNVTFIRQLTVLDTIAGYVGIRLDGIPFGSYDVDMMTDSYEAPLDHRLRIDADPYVPVSARLTLDLVMPAQILVREGRYLGSEGRLDERRRYLKDTLLRVIEEFDPEVNETAVGTFLFNRDCFRGTGGACLGVGTIAFDGTTLTCTIPISTLMGSTGARYEIRLDRHPCTVMTDGSIVVDIDGRDLISTKELTYRRFHIEEEESPAPSVLEDAIACADPSLVRMRLTFMR